MKPETVQSLEYARKLLNDASKMLDSGLNEHAARTAYLACFHTARAYSFERSGHAAKTHRGVHSEFYRLSKDVPGLDQDLRGFLSRAYRFKATADYETGPDDDVTLEDARDAVQIAARFVEVFGGLAPTRDP